MLRLWRKLWTIYHLQISMSLLGALLSLCFTGVVCNQPLDYWMVSTTNQIEHTGYSPDDERQKMVQKAYELGWLDFVLMIECESWFNPNARGDSWKSVGLCQMNTRWHKLPQEYYDSWEYQIDYCYQKRKGWTKFYGPQRIIKGQTCKNYVKNRFIINN